MRKSRWLAGWKDSVTKPVIYHCISRVVDRRFVFEERECEAFRMYMRMYENFSGCRVLSYCVMSNHFHLLVIGVENSHENSSPHGSLVGHRPPVGMSLAVGGTNLELLSRAKKSAVECK